MSKKARGRGHLGKDLGKFYANRGKSKVIDAGSAGLSLIREDTGEILDPNATIDLEAIQRETGKTPSFRTVKADPMRPFTSKPLDRAYVKGAEDGFRHVKADGLGNVLVPIGGATQKRLDNMRRPGETDNDLVSRLLNGAGIPSSAAQGDRTVEIASKIKDALEPLSEDSRARVIERIRFAVEDPTQDGFFKKILGTLEHLEPDQQDAMLSAMDARNRPAMVKILRDRERQLTREIQQGNVRRQEIRTKKEILTLKLAALADIEEMVKAPKLEKLGETCFHKCVEAWRSGNIILPLSDEEEVLPQSYRDSLDLHLTVFVVQHNWASAFQRATDFADGEWKMPYNEMVFEFRITGRRVCCTVVCSGEDGIPTACILNIETRAGCTLGAAYEITGGTWNAYIKDGDPCSPIINLCREQIRAICIALEAEVAVTEVVRAPHRLNRKRERRGQLPIFDHHVVSLANRKRYAPREILPGDIEDEKHGKRLHFVRGHWRHYTNSKTWVKWHLRGNPDLGYVDKEYRL